MTGGNDETRDPAAELLAPFYELDRARATDPELIEWLISNLGYDRRSAAAVVWELRHPDERIKFSDSALEEPGRRWTNFTDACPECGSADLIWDNRSFSGETARVPPGAAGTWVICCACGWKAPSDEAPHGSRKFMRWADVPAIEERLREILPEDDPLHPDRYQGPFGMMWSQAAMDAIRYRSEQPTRGA